jgi:hypothetical protein
MNKEEFIGKLQMVYVGDRNAFNEIVEDNQRLKNEVVYSKVEIDRLNNIIDELEKWCNECIDYHIIARENGDTTISDTFFEIVLVKLKELKEK